VPARQLPSGTILVDVPERADVGVVLYARVTLAVQRTDLDSQVVRMVPFATADSA